MKNPWHILITIILKILGISLSHSKYLQVVEKKKMTESSGLCKKPRKKGIQSMINWDETVSSKLDPFLCSCII